MEKIIGIDFSLNSTAICIYNGSYEFISVINTDTFYNKKGDKILSKYKTHNEIKKFIAFEFNKKNEKIENYSDNEIKKINDYDILSDIILKYIDKNSIIGLEGFSYNSNGRSEIDLILAQSILRYKIIKKGYNLRIIPPTVIKKHFTDNGNANKLKMLNSFIINHKISHSLYNYIKNNLENIIKGNKISKPIDDLIDAFAIVNYLKN